MANVYHTFYSTKYKGFTYDQKGKKQQVKGEVFGNYDPIKLTRSLRRSTGDENIIVMECETKRKRYRMSETTFRENAEEMEIGND